MTRKLTDVDALYLGTDEVERMFIGNTLVWNGDHVPELQVGGSHAQDVYYDAASWSAPAHLGNQGTDSTNFDLTAEGTGLTNTKVWTGLLPGDGAEAYVGDIDPTVYGSEPYSLERLVEQYPYLYRDNAIGALSTIPNTGTEGSTGNVSVESASAYNATRNMYFPGVATNYLSTPDAAALDITTSIEITFRFAPMEPDNQFGNQRIVAKSGSSRGYEVFIASGVTGHGTLNFTRDGITAATSTKRLPFLPEHLYWVRVTYNSATGETKFYYAPDNASEPSSWTQLGATVTTVTGAIVANNETLKIGTYNGSGDMFKGRLYNLIIRNADTAGATVLNIDIPTDTASMTQDVTTTFTATSGQTITLTKSGSPPNTVRVIPSGGWTLTNGNQYGTATNLSELATIENQLQIIWVRATSSGYSTTRRIIYPLLRVYNSSSAPYQNNSWGMYLDTLGTAVNFTMQVGGTATSEIFVSGLGLTTATGDQIYGIALLEMGGQTWGYQFRYNPATDSFVFPNNAQSSSLLLLTGTDMIGTSNTLEMWQGIAGFDITEIGIANIPDFTSGADMVRFNDNGGSILAELYLEPLVENHMRTVVLGESSLHTPGTYWRASADGALEIASEAVETGDLFVVKTVNPTTWKQIKFDHPSRRKTLFRSRNTTIGSPANPISVTAPEDFFVWAVAAIPPENDDYLTYSYDSATSSFMDIDVYFDGDGWNIYMEIDDDGGNRGWVSVNETDSGIPPLFQSGHSSPTLFAMGVNKTDNLWKAWVYDLNNGLQTFNTQDPDPPTWTSSTITMDSVWFFGPDQGEGYTNTLFWGGGWTQGVGIIPTEDGLVELWERAVYGYPLG